ncbi:MAG: DUF4197 domain-containing protein, partial [Bacteroidales bacterium]|nr:DUF4197 domain-containing protein [Bacteroidales bacterium]
MKQYILQGTALLLSAQLFFSCDKINNVLPQGNSDLTSTEIVDGLKTALNIGVDSSTFVLSGENGYYNNLATRIPLPDEVNTIMSTLEKLETYAPGLTSGIEAKVTDLAKSINSSAGEA